MFDPKICKGADISTTYAGIKLRSPFILSSGPLGYGSEGLIRAHKAGCGAVVTKTLRLNRAINPAHHIGTMGPNSLINCEKWADSDRLQWYEKEIPAAKAAGAVVMVVGFIYDRVMLRCPDCHKYVGKNEEDSKCCPRCGKILE